MSRRQPPRSSRAAKAPGQVPARPLPAPGRHLASPASSAALLASGVDLHRRGQMDVAAGYYRRVLALEPAQGDALHLLGLIHAGRNEIGCGVTAMRRAIASGCHAAAGNLAAALINHAAGALPVPDAIAGLRLALALEPAQANAWNNLATSLRRDGDGAGAGVAARRSLRLRPDQIQASWNAARACVLAGRLGQASAFFHMSLALDPGYADVWADFGRIIEDRCLAARTIRRALRCRFDMLESIYTLALIRETQRAFGEAADMLRRVLAYEPADSSVLNSLGAILRRDGLLDESGDAFARALTIAPQRQDSLCNLVLHHRDRGEIAACRAALERAEAAYPKSPHVQGVALSTVTYDPDIDPAAHYAVHRRYNDDQGAPLAVHHRWLPNTPDPERRIRIGYVSSDLREHPLSRSLLALVTERDRTGTSIWFYADCREPDEVTARFRAQADGWRDITGKSDVEVAEMVRTDAIDILVILCGRFDGNRPLVAACRAAPVQVSYADVATSGIDAMDYLFADAVLIPRRGIERFSERVLRLPGYVLQSPLAGCPDPGPPPMLRNGYVTFGSFANPSKINDAVLAWWGRILMAVPNSRLSLRFFGYYRSRVLCRRVLDRLAEQGIDAGRVSFLDISLPPDGHMALYRDIDIGLDTFPFCGSTTSFESVWMGVPVITLPGFTMVSRWTAKILTDLELTDFIAVSADQSVDIARRWAAAPERLARLRTGLRDRVLASPLVDGAGKARHLDRLYRAVWRRWCGTQRPLPGVNDLLHAAVNRFRLGQAGPAAALCGMVVALDPAQGDALHLFGLSRAMTGDVDQGLRAMRRALIAGCAAAAGNLTTALINRAVATSQSGPAISGLRTALVLAPAHADAWNSLATWQRRAAEYDAAGMAAGRALRIFPFHWRALWNAGQVADAQRRQSTAVTYISRALAVEPALADVWADLGRLSDEPATAESLLRRALRCRNDHAEALANLANLVRMRRDLTGAAALGCRALAIAPAHPTVLDRLGTILRDGGNIDAAVIRFQRELAVDPRSHDGLCNLSLLLKDIGDIGESLSRLALAHAAHPGSAAVQRLFLWAASSDPAADPAAHFAVHRRFADAADAVHAAHRRPLTNTPEPDRPIRIGCLSSDLRQHPVARNLEPLIARRDRDRTALIFYADCRRPDAVSERLRRYGDGWRDIAGKSDGDVAEMIRGDAIDVLVIVGGRFDDNRPQIAACRAAPVQVSLFDAATSGLSDMDYLLTDRCMTPRHTAEHFTERPVRLPVLTAYSPLADAPEPGPPPCLRNGYVTFASFNNPAKLNDAVLDLWGRLMAGLPGSRLILRYHNWFASDLLRRRVVTAIGRHGVDADRLIFMEAALDGQGHLEIYRDADIALDPFPFGGATTSFEALSMGLPVLTLPTFTMMSRWTASLLTAIGLPELIAATPDGFIDIARDLAGDTRRLCELRRTLGARVAASPLCNSTRTARHFDRAIRAMWRKWCREQGRP